MLFFCPPSLSLSLSHSLSLHHDALQKRRRENLEERSEECADFSWSQTDLSLTWRVRPRGRSMPYARAVRQWEIRPTSALWGIRRTRALMWQRIRGLVRACRGAGYSVNYNDPEREEQEMVCLEVWKCGGCCLSYEELLLLVTTSLSCTYLSLSKYQCATNLHWANIVNKGGRQSNNTTTLHMSLSEVSSDAVFH